MLKQFWKKIRRYEATYRIVCFIAASYMWLVYQTSRWTVYGEDTPRQYTEQGKPFIMAFWHGRLLMIPFLWRRRASIEMLISGHADGLFIARTVKYFGIESISGSKSQGGTAAFRKMVQAARDGRCVGITPDGPRGPYMQASDGVISLARLTGLPVIPVSYAVKKGKFLRSWDRFLLPCPFTKGVLVWGKPVTIEKNDNPDAARKTLQNKMIALTKKADSFCGRETPQ